MPGGLGDRGLPAAGSLAHGPRLDRIDILINNAGVYPASPLLEMAEEEWDLVVDSNLKSTHLCTRAVAKMMIGQAHGGAIVNIASIERLAPAAGHAPYASAKAGVLMHTRTAALELGCHGIRVNAVAPGLIWKPEIEEEWPDGAARWITGTTLAVDGGMLSTPAF